MLCAGLQDRDQAAAAEHPQRGVRPRAAGELQDGDRPGAQVRHPHSGGANEQ